ncbi:3-isopropylmalate/(R)-2-methylmalate dehydratase small subunit [Arthrobacter pascens]|uniref:3-isopropylmalate dehydratase small subunit n=1 Tax=Arthrobacter pascens TaxID=1677 RepID=UPI00285495A3|nr:3-isopropylmalate dehydratase small subunit [Arthrobacter pascens]MDR6558286.1 3-isopropylmalate/(R)-2-methylmalate dehydratase small subunit [Arthrobacter pascens]
MDKFSTHTGVGIPLRRTNVDTDQIIPSAFLKRITRTGFEDALFAQWREDPGFVLNSPLYGSGSVLVAGPDFGTGSSREHAVWALLDYGIKVVVSSRFADIFRGNSGKAGLLTAQVTGPDLERIWGLLDGNPGLEIAVDLPSQTISIAQFTIPFDIDPYVKWRLERGYDDIGLTEQHREQISDFENRRPDFMPSCS